jgi:Transcriptional regulators
MMRSMAMLEEAFDRLTPTEQKVAQHLLKLGDALLDTSIADVAKACGTGKSLVVSTCKKAGFKGYKDLCLAMSAAAALDRFSPQGAYIDIYPDTPSEDVCRIILKSTTAAIEDTFALMDVKQMEQVAASLIAARRILLVGVGASGIVAQDTHHKMQRIGLNAHFTMDAHCQLLAALPLTKEDCVLAFSASGETHSVLETVRVAKENGALIVAITHIGQSSLEKLSDMVFPVAAGQTAFRHDGLTSRQSMLTVMDMLTTLCAGLDYDKTLTLLNRASEYSARFKEKNFPPR